MRLLTSWGLSEGALPLEVTVAPASPPWGPASTAACGSLNLACKTHKIAQPLTCSHLQNTALWSLLAPTSVFD